MKRRRPPRLLSLGVTLCLCVGCASTRMEVPPHAPRYALAKTALKVAVTPFGDQREHRAEDRSLWYGVPFVPWSTATYDRPDESRVDPDHPDHFRFQLPRLLAEHLEVSRLFGEVSYLPEETVDPARHDLWITGEVHKCVRQERRTLYGLSLVGFAFWLLGAPIGWDRIAWEVDLQIRDPKSKRHLKTIRQSFVHEQYLGLYWGASGFPEQEAIGLRPLLGELLKEIDRALDEVPELAALTARPVLAPQPRSPLPEPTKIDSGTIVVLAAGEGGEAIGLSEVVVEALGHRVKGPVLGESDLNAALDWERKKDLLGCEDPDCFLDLREALHTDLIVHLRLGRLGEEPALTVKLIEVKNANVLSRTTWTATGSGAASFVPRIPEIIDAVLQPLIPERGKRKNDEELSR